jgi:hypothetical protein
MNGRTLRCLRRLPSYKAVTRIEIHSYRRLIMRSR